jgi:hypothetical protein
VQSLAHAVDALVWAVLTILISPTILLLLARRYVPMLGNPLWRGYCRLLRWVAVAPFRLLRLVSREALNRRR